MLNVTLTGNLGADPEVRFTQSGMAILQFRMAVNSRRRQGEEWADRTDWFRVQLPNPSEAMSQRLTKGSRVLVVGRLEISEYESRQRQGEKVTALDVWADAVEDLTPRPPRDGQPGAPTPIEAAASRGPGGTSPTASPAGAADEDLPL
jgi:single-strand DNA-binding protein